MYLRSKGMTFRVLSASLVFFFATSFILPKDALAYRSRDGGGEIAEFSFGDFASTVGISMGMFIVGQIVTAGLGSAWNYFSTGSELASQTSGLVNEGMSLAEEAQGLVNALYESGVSLSEQQMQFADIVWKSGSQLQNLASQAAIAGPQVSQNASGIIGNLQEGLQGLYGTLDSSIGNLVQSNFSTLAQADQVAQMVTNLTGLQNTASTLAETASSVSNSFSSVGNLSANMTKMGDSVFSAMGNGITNSFNSWDKVGMNLVNGYNTFVAASLTGQAVGTMGYYYEWSRPTTFIASTVATGIVGGFLNPSVSLGDTIPKGTGMTLAQYNFNAGLTDMLRGGAVGGLTGLAKSLAIVAVDREEIEQGRSPGPWGQIAGLLATISAANLSRALVNPDTWFKNPEIVIQRERNQDYYELKNSANTALELAQESGSEAETYRMLAANWRDEAPELANEYLRLAEIREGEATSNKILAQTLSKEANNPWAYLDAQSHQRISPDKVDEYLRNDSRYFGSDAGKGYGPLSANTLVVTQSDYPLGPLDWGRRLFDAAVIKTLDAWPQIATQSLSIIARDAVRDKKQDLLSEEERRDNFDGLGMLVGGVVEGVGGALFSRLSQFYGLTPGLYIGEKSDIEAMSYKENMIKVNAQLGIKDSESRVSALGSTIFKDLTFALLESAVNSGARYLVSKIDAHHDNPLSAAAEVYAAGMAMALVRGIVWDLTWKPNKGNEWADTVSFVKLRVAETNSHTDIWDKARDNYQYALNSRRQDTEINLAESFGLLPKAERQLYGGTTRIIDTYTLDLLGSAENKPGLANFITNSLLLANYDFANKAFAFGAPITRRPEDVNVFLLNDFLSTVNAFGFAASRSNWFKRGVATGIENAATSVMTNDLMLAIASNKTLSDTFNLQQIRLTRTNAPDMPFMIQFQDPQAPGLFKTNTFALPDSDIIAKSRTAKKSYLREYR